MEEIEYRAWSETAHSFSCATIKEGAGPIYVHGTPEQWTGLRDKNGAKIYVGDILEKAKIPLEVVFEDGKFMCRGVPQSSLKALAKYGIVIGNIHENKDLLGEKDD